MDGWMEERMEIYCTCTEIMHARSSIRRSSLSNGDLECLELRLSWFNHIVLKALDGIECTFSGIK